MDSRFDRALGDPEDLGDLTVGETFDVVEQDRKPKSRLQAFECPANLRRDLDPAGRVLGISRRVRQVIAGGLSHCQLLNPSPVSAEGPPAIERGVRGDPIDEGRKTRISPEAMPVAMQAQEGLLGDILCLLAVAHHT